MFPAIEETNPEIHQRAEHWQLNGNFTKAR